MVNEQIALARRYVEQTDMSLFLTGKAGTGKTTFLRELAATCPKRHVVVAPTGVAAVGAGGVTIHSFFQLPFEPYLPEVKELITEYQMPNARKALSRSKQDIIRTLELLIIDEISMVRADLLDAIDMTLRRYRRNSRPFGGVQLLMIGDVHQLPPVVTDRERPYMERVYPSPFFFNSKALRQLGFLTIELTTVYRQQDAAFVGLLNRVRENRLDAATLTTLNTRVGTPPDEAITLTTHNYQADAINRSHMAALKGPGRTFDALVEGTFAESAMPIDRHLELKVGERVMFVKNDSLGAHRYFNGKLATVTGFAEQEDSTTVEVVDDDGDTISVGREQWESLSYSINPTDNSIEQHVDGTFSQYPLRPAWAVTIHKAQGLTFDRVAINAADAFAFGQVYVALSRCRTLEGLTLTTPLGAAVAFSDGDVNRFCAEQPTFDEVSRLAPQYEQRYYFSQLADLFVVDALVADMERLQEVYAKLKKLYPEQFQALGEQQSALVDLVGINERFQRQLHSLPADQHPGRIAKASEYYVVHLSPIAVRMATLLEVEVDNKETRKQLQEAGNAFSHRLGLKLACLEAVRRKGFSVAVVQQARTDYLVEGTPARSRRKAAAPTATPAAAAAPTVLLDHLRAWRSQKASELGLKPYLVLQQKALIAIANNRPSTPTELLDQPSIGEKTLEAYGEELLALVASHQAGQS